MFEYTTLRPRAYCLEKLRGTSIHKRGCNYLVVAYPEPVLNGETEVSTVKARFLEDNRVHIGDRADYFGRLGISASRKVISEVIGVLEEKGFKRQK